MIPASTLKLLHLKMGKLRSCCLTSINPEHTTVDTTYKGYNRLIDRASVAFLACGCLSALKGALDILGASASPESHLRFVRSDP